VVEYVAISAGAADPARALAGLGLTPQQALAAMVFFTLYMPCMWTAAAIYAATRRLSVAAGITAYSLVLAYTAMLLVYAAAGAVAP
jgi:Fe2+ transport system protein B